MNLLKVFKNTTKFYMQANIKLNQKQSHGGVP